MLISRLSGIASARPEPPRPPTSSGTGRPPPCRSSFGGGRSAVRTSGTRPGLGGPRRAPHAVAPTGGLLTPGQQGPTALPLIALLLGEDLAAEAEAMLAEASDGTRRSARR